ncbi:MAG: dihydrolipoyl dehydrogenase [Streptosporangiales bacterium]|nr:dihydrolipoyl dehydrogenase [Streptosporangiales bacterium]
MTDAGTNSYDLVVLGGGSGGYAAAFRAAELGMTVAVVEKDKFGGTCLHRGCIPTKALLHAAEVADQVQHSADFGVTATFGGIDIEQVNAYKDKVVGGLYKGLTGLAKAHKVALIEGEGRVESPTTVRVGDQVLTGRHLLLGTGSVPKSLPGLEIDGQRIITSDHALRMNWIPKSAVILGGGVIGVEFASVWRSFGADVTIVEMLPHLLPPEDLSSQKLIERAFRRRKITAELGARFEGVKTTETGVTVSLEGGKTIDAEVLLVAVGRGPVSSGLGYEEIGVRVDRGFVQVDEYCQTSVPGVSAVGDLIPTLQLAHVGFAEGILVAERLGGLDPVPIDYAGVPRITYSNPEVASVGLTEQQAVERYGADAVTTFDYNLAGNGKSQILKTSGAVKLVQQKDGPVVGIHMVGERMGELSAEAQLIYNWEALPADVAQLIHPHPTQSEAIGEAHLALAGKPLHVHG